MSDAPPNRSIWIVLSYLWILAVIPLVFERDDEDARWHAKHGLVLLVTELVLFIAYVLLTVVVSTAAVALGIVLVTLLVFGWIGILAIHVVAILKGLNGRRLMLPVVSPLVDRFN